MTTKQEIAAEELRLGNILSYYGTPVIVLEIRRNDNLELWYFTDSVGFSRYCTDEGISPVELTTDILERCGFERDRNGYRLEDLYSLSFTEKFMPCFNDRPISKNEIQYLHQLQNIYKLLTGTHLTPTP